MTVPEAYSPSEPTTVQFALADYVAVVVNHFAERGTWAPQHVHVYEHTTVLAHGCVRVWKDGVFDQVYTAPSTIVIAAGVAHLFQTMEPDTTILCIHNVSRAGAIEILGQHRIKEV